MSIQDSTPSTRPDKPNKPRDDFPLFAHASGQWAKKIRGKMYYFGKWDDPDAALDSYLKQKEDLHAGRTPRPDPEGVTVKDAVNAFLNHKQALLDASELSPRTWADYKSTTDLIISALGQGRLVEDLRPENFAALRNRMTKRWGPIRLRDFIQRIRSVFEHALDAELIDSPCASDPVSPGRRRRLSAWSGPRRGRACSRSRRCAASWTRPVRL